ncbi:GNAT family N-acetyltransferase [Canibacter sp. lx-72]|uniref:GNAT family N-acetyltransferase n=1 Tax=Canibacter zhuwentaonis TaxID=2837491 RepID=UPI001BDD41EA|nr:GNAT family N-acetyltransferase [Canibacter zhuwentaonis]
MWSIKKFDELSTDDLFEIYKLRVSVFVVEQECHHQEVDDNDKVCLHGMKWVNGKLAAYFRLIPKEDGIHLGRVIVAPSFRNRGLGRELVQAALKECQLKFPNATVHAQAQAYLKLFYSSFGFKTTSNIYLMGGIQHIDMELQA